MQMDILQHDDLQFPRSLPEFQLGWCINRISTVDWLETFKIPPLFIFYLEKRKMPPISSKTTLALALAVSTELSGCATTLGYVKDHPDPALTSNYNEVKTWAYGVSDGYSSRGTMNRYSLYVGGAIAAAGIGALGGLAVTGSSGNASVIIPLTATFIGTLFGCALY
jgi:hypothetical protein